MENSVTKIVTIAGLAAIAAAYGEISAVSSSAESKGESVADVAGNLRVPDAYRTDYQFLGSWAVGGEQGSSSKEFHVVYASPGTIDAYRRTGLFPDGTVLVKEVFQAATGRLTTGNVGHAETLKGWFIMMKGGDGRYAGNKLWGDGWGWSGSTVTSRQRRRQPITRRIAWVVMCRREAPIGSMSTGTHH